MARAIQLSLENVDRGNGGPFGAVIVKDGSIVAEGVNSVTAKNDPTAHAEIVALRLAAKAIGNYRLTEATLYVTVEPCAMCAGAMIQARIPRLVYGADDPKGGAVRTCFQLLDNPRLNHRIEFTPGVGAAEAVALLQRFFAERR